MLPCVDRRPALSYAQLLDSFTVYDLKRLKAYANQMVDFHVVMDLTPASKLQAMSRL